MRGMANPAQLLHAFLSGQRKVESYPDPQQQRIAVSHLDAIEELLARMDAAEMRTALYRRHFDRWVELTLRIPQAWQPAAKRHIDDRALENLDHLADRLGDLVQKIEPGGLDTVRDYVSSVRELLDSDHSVQDFSLRQHLLQVIAHVNWCLDNFKAVGEFNLQEAIERLAAAMIRVTAHSKQKDRWRDVLNNVVWPFATNAAASIAVAPATLAITTAFGG